MIQKIIHMHETPEDEQAPLICRLFHELVRGFVPELPALPPFPCERHQAEGQQLSLF